MSRLMGWVCVFSELILFPSYLIKKSSITFDSWFYQWFYLSMDKEISDVLVSSVGRYYSVIS